jgi:hypothetical protein
MSSTQQKQQQQPRQQQGGPSDAPPGLNDMFINSADSLRHRVITQKIPPSWNDKPPLFEIIIPSRSRPYLWGRQKPKEDHITEDEDPNLLKGVSEKSSSL